MSRQIPEQTVQHVLELTDIVALIGEYVTLRRRGANFLGLCPFHSEKTPSFSVNPIRRFYYCFGCHQSGDAISFLRECNGLTFEEAVRELADRVGVPVVVDEDPEAEKQRRQRQSERKRLFGINERAARFFVAQLGGASPAVREFLDQRGLTQEIVEQFGLGYAPDEWDALTRMFERNNEDTRLVERLGLVVRKDTPRGDRVYDRFRHRVMFPVYDLSGAIIAFGGRTLSDDKQTAKYMNSPDSSLYRKGDVLFGLQQAKAAIRQSGFAILVEGNIDLLRMHQFGFSQTVAPMGTALTRNQAQLLRRFTDRVVLIYDGDSAGIAAAEKSLPFWISVGMDAALVELPEGEDPDTFLDNYGRSALLQLIERATPLFEGVLERRVGKGELTPHQQTKIIDEFVELLGLIDDDLEQRLYLERVATRLGVEPTLIAQRLGKGESAAASGAGDRDRTNAAPERTRPKGDDAARRKAEHELLLFLAQHPPYFANLVADGVYDLVGDTTIREALDELRQRPESERPADGTRFIEAIDDAGLRQWLAKRLMTENPSEVPPAKIYEQLVGALRRFVLKGEQRRLQQQIEAAGDQPTQLQLDLLRSKQSRLMAMLGNRNSGG